MLYIDEMFANRLSSYLNNFRQTGQSNWNFRCPVCGDSKKSQKKSRGNIYKTNNKLLVKCFNCDYTASFDYFLKSISDELYKEYIFEKLKLDKPKEDYSIFKQESNIEIIDSNVDSLIRIDTLPENHPVKLFCVNRKIRQLELLYLVPKFKQYINSLIPNKFKLEKDHPRLIIPFFNEHGKMIGLQGRSFGKELPRYYTIKLSDEEMIYGLDRVDYSKEIRVVEGPIDSLFVNNGIAVAGSSFSGYFIETIKTNSVLIYDNEPRSKEITKLLKGKIDNNYRVLIWPDTIKEKDINEMVLSGYDIEKIIKENTYQGLVALTKFNQWKKV